MHTKVTYNGKEYQIGNVIRHKAMGGYNVHTIMAFEETPFGTEMRLARPYANAGGTHPYLACEVYTVPLYHLDSFEFCSNGYILNVGPVK